MTAEIIFAACPACGAKAKVKPTALLRDVTCPKCRKPVRFAPIPEAQPVPAIKPEPMPAAYKPVSSPAPAPQVHKTVQPKPQTIDCPFCAEPIQSAAKKCKHCGEFLNEIDRPTTPLDSPPTKTKTQPKARPQKGVPVCMACGGAMKKSTSAESGALGCIVCIVGILLTPAIVGIPILLFGLHLGMKRKGVWRCNECKAEVERKLGMLEWG